MSVPATGPLTIGIVANEPSGDLLGASVARALRQRLPEVRFVGVAGPRMQAEGCATLLPMERLSVMGLLEVLGHLRELLGLRRQLLRHFLAEPPAVFIGIDAPDFNLGLERRLRAAGIPAVHVVSPTVWAWRPGRVKGIRRSVDLLLSLFPFEERFLRRHGVPATYVGHPLADEIPLETDRAGARAVLGLPASGPVIALLPGSRRGEMRRHAAPFIDAARRCHAARPDLSFAVPLISAELGEHFRRILALEAPELPVRLLDGQAREAIAAADVVLTASGTATLETLLLKRPMVAAYRIHPLSYRLIRWLRLVKVPHIAMANLLAGQELAPEFVQDDCRGDRLAAALLALLDDPERVARIQAEYRRIHLELRRDAASRAAEAILELLGRGTA